MRQARQQSANRENDITTGRGQDHGRLIAVRRLRDSRGQYTLEWSVLMVAVVLAISAMLSYVRDALRANVKLTEIQLNGAMQDNRPIENAN